MGVCVRRHTHTGMRVVVYVESRLPALLASVLGQEARRLHWGMCGQVRPVAQLPQSRLRQDPGESQLCPQGLASLYLHWLMGAAELGSHQGTLLAPQRSKWHGSCLGLKG